MKLSRLSFSLGEDFYLLIRFLQMLYELFELSVSSWVSLYKSGSLKS